MSYKTQKIAAQIKSFNNSPEAMNLTNVFGALNHRALGHKHFEQAKTHILKMMEAAGDAIVSRHFRNSQELNPSQKLQDRVLDFSLIYMTVNKSDEEILTPISMRGLIGHETAILCTRELPLRLSTQHLEFRHIQRTCEPLVYHSDDFKYAIAFSLGLSAVLAKKMVPGSEPVPCLIPHTDGVFLGVAEHRGDFWSETHAGFRHYDKNGPFVGMIAGSVYGSPVTIELKTSLGRHEISKRQTELRERLLLPGFPNCDNVMARGMDIHALCAMHEGIPQREKDAWHIMCDRLETVVDTPLWREEGQIALRNLKRHEYN